MHALKHIGPWMAQRLAGEGVHTLRQLDAALEAAREDRAAQAAFLARACRNARAGEWLEDAETRVGVVNRCGVEALLHRAAPLSASNASTYVEH